MTQRLTLNPSSQEIHRSPRVRKQAMAYLPRWCTQPTCRNWVIMASIHGNPVLPCGWKCATNKLNNHIKMSIYLLSPFYISSYILKVQRISIIYHFFQVVNMLLWNLLFSGHKIFWFSLKKDVRLMWINIYTYKIYVQWLLN